MNVHLPQPDRQPLAVASQNPVAVRAEGDQTGAVTDVTDVTDRILIHEVINLHGHLMDEGHLDRLHELFTDDVRYDVSALGGAVLEGVQAIADAGLTLGAANPLGHHVTNVIVTEIDDDRARARSKGLGVMTSGGVGSVVYADELRRTTAGWRISARKVLPRTTPLQPSNG